MQQNDKQKDSVTRPTLEEKRKHIQDFTKIIQDEENPVLLPENSTTALYMFRGILDSERGGGDSDNDPSVGGDENTITKQYNVLSLVGLDSWQSLIQLKNILQQKRAKMLSRIRQKDFPFPRYKQELAVYLNLDLYS